MSRSSSPVPSSLAITAGDASTLDLQHLPAIFVSRTHLDDSELHAIEQTLEQSNATLTYDITEAGIILSKVTKKPRILFDLRTKGLLTEEVKLDELQETAVGGSSDSYQRRTDATQGGHVARPSEKPEDRVIVISDSSTESEGDTEAGSRKKVNPRHTSESATGSEPLRTLPLGDGYIVRVLRLTWLEESHAAGQVLPLTTYTGYAGRKITNQTRPMTSPEHVTKRLKLSTETTSPSQLQSTTSLASLILERAKEDATQTPSRLDRSSKRRFGQFVSSAPTYTSNNSWSSGHQNPQFAQLVHTTTSQEDPSATSELPEPPDWVQAGIKYACQRPTPQESPNETFISLLKEIKTARLLTLDEIGVRAYSTSIAALAAYPYRITKPREVLRLPGCDAKIANLYVEWINTGKIRAVEDVEEDADLTVLRLFYDIWGVGATTAREFYYDRGWQDLDDLVEYNWKGLTRVQQIGVKYYEEFLDPIPRAEVEAIGKLVHEHAVKVRDKEVQSLIVGGYRRGKAKSGDVDIIVSHPDESQTLNVVTDIVASLEDEGWITHTLLLSLHSTHRDQQTLPFRSGNAHGGHGFDTLDKALVVWQDPHWPTKDADLAANPKAKNPNIHRRVDIIVSPWRTVGCAVTGWSGGTTFQRDLRRYAKNVHGWKFDSSGVRDRANGEVLDLEGFHRYDGSIGTGRAKTMVQAEQRVFEGLKLEYQEPYNRCTG